MVETELSRDTTWFVELIYRFLEISVGDILIPHNQATGGAGKQGWKNKENQAGTIS